MILDSHLKHLLTDEFAASVPPASTAAVLCRALSLNASVQELGAALENQVLNENQLIEFAENLAREFRSGVRLPHELAMAAIAVVLSERHTARAQEFVGTMAGLRLRELSDAIGVARECLQRHATRTPTTIDRLIKHEGEDG